MDLDIIAQGIRHCNLSSRDVRWAATHHDARIPGAKIVIVPRPEVNFPATFDGQGPVTVQLQLVNPDGTLGKRLRRQGSMKVALASRGTPFSL